MSEMIQVGNIVKGKVASIKPFGAFVALDETHTGLVHISQVAHGFVKDINEYLHVGDEVEVKIMSIDSESGKISLSIKETKPAEEASNREVHRKSRPQREGGNNYPHQNSELYNTTLQDQLKEWLKKENE